MKSRTADDRRTEKRRLHEPHKSSVPGIFTLFLLSIIALETLYIISTWMPA